MGHKPAPKSVLLEPNNRIAGPCAVCGESTVVCVRLASVKQLHRDGAIVESWAWQPNGSTRHGHWGTYSSKLAAAHAAQAKGYIIKDGPAFEYRCADDREGA